jgi:hypothetical protein
MNTGFRLASRLILTADLQVALLIGSSADECAANAYRPILKRLKYYVRVKIRVIVVDCLLVLGILVQWWLVGSWLDRVPRQVRPLRRWIIPIAVITAGALVMAPTAFGQRGVAELVNISSGKIALLAWIVLIVMFIIVGSARVIRRILDRTSKPVSSPS